ncbi:MAG: alpha-galactosidase [Bacteroidales bacterium]|nr:alpha-galactosidase [Bacteroidales bacterium]
MRYRGLLLLLLFINSTLLAQNKADIYVVETENSSMIFSGKTGEKFKFQYYGEKFDDPGQFLRSGIGLQQEALTTFGIHCAEDNALRVTHADGNMSLDLYLESVESNVIDENITLTKVNLKDDKYPFHVSLFYKSFYDEDIIEAWTEITHQEKKAVSLYKFASFSMTVQSFDPWLVHFHGDWADEFNMTEERITRGLKEIKNREGVRSSRHDNPSFMFALDGKPLENKGHIIGGTLAWSGPYKISFNNVLKNKINIIAGMNEEASHYTLEKDEVFETPVLILTYSDCGKGQVSRNFHQWARKNYLIDGMLERKILLNSWEGVYFDTEEKDMLGMIDDIADMGGELFVMDDGWFGDKYPRDNDKSSLGDWMINKRKLPNGLTPLIQRAEDRGIQFGIWLEPEMINDKSELYDTHPEWVVQQPNREIVKGRAKSQMLLDMSNPEVQDFVYSIIHDLLVEYPKIGYIKWDANHFISNYGSNYLPDDKQSHLYIEYHRGLKKTVERIRMDHPDIVIQSCASGGGRVNYAYMPYFHEFWTSDLTDAVSRLKIQWGTSYFFPSIVMASHVSASPNHQTGRMLPLKFRSDVAMTGRYGLELQPKDLNEDEKEFVKSSIKTYKSIRPVIQFGDLYRLISPYDGYGIQSLMYVNSDKDRAIVFVFSLNNNLRNKYPSVILDGLDMGKIYTVKEINKTEDSRNSSPAVHKAFSGDFLMKAGLQVNLRRPYQSAVFELVVEK